MYALGIQLSRSMVYVSAFVGVAAPNLEIDIPTPSHIQFHESGRALCTE